jgi:hypothetical protein
MQSVVLPFPWSRMQVGAILARVRTICLLTLQGNGLQAAAQIAAGQMRCEHV